MGGIVFNFDLASGSELQGRFAAACDELGYDHSLSAEWPYVGDPIASTTPARSAVGDDGESGFLYELAGEVATYALALAWTGHGMARVRAASSKPYLAGRALEEVRSILPRDDGLDPGRVPITFWAYGPHGPMQVARELDAPSWEAIEGNYAGPARAGLEPLMAEGFRPSGAGQLVLWHGEPGTGKTTALRALAQAWRGWARLHYITDPDKFFGERADYMLNVMLGQDLLTVEEAGRSEAVADPWRLLILEDAGELLQRDAKDRTGQALSRLLNAVDGLIGQGLRVLVLVTTNEELGSWHPAITRHGRALSKVEFTKLGVEEAATWRGAHGLDPRRGAALLSDLYAEAEGRLREPVREPVGFG